MYSTWAKRCDKVVFVSEEDDEVLPVMKVNVTGRENLWGKTKLSLVEAYREYGAHMDWVLKVSMRFNISCSDFCRQIRTLMWSWKISSSSWQILTQVMLSLQVLCICVGQ